MAAALSGEICTPVLLASAADRNAEMAPGLWRLLVAVEYVLHVAGDSDVALATAAPVSLCGIQSGLDQPDVPPQSHPALAGG